MKKAYVISGTAVLAAIAVDIAIFSAKSGKTDNIAEPDIKTEDSTSATEPAKAVSASVNTAEQTLNLGINALNNAKIPQLQVEEVFVSAGQQVQAGTPLIQLTSDSVKAVRTTLQQELLDSSKTYRLINAEQRELRLQISQTYDNYITNAKYSGTVYNDKCDELQKKAAAAKEAADDKQNEVNENLLELTQLQQDLVNAQRYLKEAETAVYENYKNRYQNAYYYTVYEKTRKEAQSMVEQLEEQIKLHTEKNEALLYEVDEAVRACHQSALEQEKEKLAAKRNRDTEVYYAEIASEWLDIQTSDLDNALQEARERYETALQNIRDFNACTACGRIVSGHSGIISDVMVEPGDNVMQNDTLVIFASPARAQP